MKNLKFLYLNARSLKTVNKAVNKLVELKNIVCYNESDIVTVTETWLKSNVLDCEILSNAFNIYTM